jgi:hypothetical protein
MDAGGTSNGRTIARGRPHRVRRRVTPTTWSDRVQDLRARPGGMLFGGWKTG